MGRKGYAAVGHPSDRADYTGRGDVKRLTNAEGTYRLRVGEWRVRFRLVHTDIRIMLIQVCCLGVTRTNAEATIIGAGVQRETQFAYLTRVRSIDRVGVHDGNPAAGQAYAGRRQAKGCRCEVASTVAEALGDADMLFPAWRERCPGQ